MKKFIPFLVSLFVLPLFGVFAQDSIPPDMLEKSLKFKPSQEVDIDIPTEEEATRCKIDFYAERGERKGYIVTNPQGMTLRLFIDYNGSGRVNQWSYFKNGIEVYREIDTDANGNADQFRWFNTGGTKHGIDANGDFVIDQWKNISAEEVSQEIIRAVATNDLQRFLRVTLSTAELKKLALGEEHNAAVAKKLAALKAGFENTVKTLQLGENAHWYQLNDVHPAVVPAGTSGNETDLLVLENTWAAVGVRTGEKEIAKQVSIGTLVCIGSNNWRVIDLPKPYDEGTMTSTFMPINAVLQSTGPVNDEAAVLITQYQTLTAALPTVQDRAKQYKDITAVMLKIIAKSPTNEDRELWVRLLTDTIMEAVQEDAFPEGKALMQEIFETFQKLSNNELTAYIRYRQMMVDFHTDMQSGKDALKTYAAWLANLELLVKEYEKTETGIDAMLQLAVNKEMSDRSNVEPLKWYTKIAEVAAGKPIAEKAKGAIRRLNSEGQAVPYKTTDAGGKPFDITSFGGSYVLLIFWDSRNAAEVAGIKAVTDTMTGLKVVGVNLDSDAKAFQTAAGKLTNWTHLHSAGGLDSSNAVYWGIQNTPFLILYGKDGKIINSNIMNIETLKESVK
ncbi:MAG: thioredoxin family protein [Planctomycetaceae bacterium]|nr:thioredoxin family protein [Planctomycetaceae bacterium]